MIQLPDNPVVPAPRLGHLLQRARQLRVLENRGRVVQLTGLVIESEGPLASVGEVCRIESARHDGTTLAEVVGFRNHHLLLMMDSVTRFATAQREIGLAVGEPPATRGYTPSVFSLLPQLLERAGASEFGTITGLFTVLVEADDMDEPIADAVRSILDGHIVLSRELAMQNHYPAIDVLASISRLERDLLTPKQLELAGRAREAMAVYRKNQDLINIGAYPAGSNPVIDQAIQLHGSLQHFLRQPVSQSNAASESWKLLAQAVAAPEAAKPARAGLSS